MGRLPGVRLTQHDLRGRILTVEYDPATAGVERIRQSLDESGYPSTIV